MLHTHIIFLLSYSVTTFGLLHVFIVYVQIFRMYCICTYGIEPSGRRRVAGQRTLCFGLGHGHGNGLDLQAVLRHDPICVCPRQVTDVVSGCASCSCAGWLGAAKVAQYVPVVPSI